MALAIEISKNLASILKFMSVIFVNILEFKLGMEIDRLP